METYYGGNQLFMEQPTLSPQLNPMPAINIGQPTLSPTINPIQGNLFTGYQIRPPRQFGQRERANSLSGGTSLQKISPEMEKPSRTNPDHSQDVQRQDRSADADEKQSVLSKTLIERVQRIITEYENQNK